MKVTREKTENRQAYLTIEMEPAEMEASLEGSYRRLAQRTDIPGFRRGKAPRAVVERYLGRARLLEEAIDHMLPQAYEQALKEQEIEPFARPELEISQTDPLVFKAVVPLRPMVELGDYRSIRMTPEKVEVKDEAIQAVLEELRHQHATWEPVDRPLAYHDLAVIDINGDVEERPYVRKAAAHYPVEQDAMSPAPGFAEKIVGMKKDEEREFKITFPADYPNREVAGKEATFRVKLIDIKEEKLPELNDDFARQVSPEIKTLDALREEAAKGLRLRAEERSRMDFEEKVINTALEKAKIEFPPVLVEMEINRILNDQERQLRLAGQSVEEYLERIKKTPEQLIEELRPVATRNVRASLLLEKIAEAEKIEVTEEDVTNSINNMLRSIGEDRREEYRKLLDTPGRRESLKESILMRKAIERLAEIARDACKTDEQLKEGKNEQPDHA